MVMGRGEACGGSGEGRERGGRSVREGRRKDEWKGKVKQTGRQQQRDSPTARNCMVYSESKEGKKAGGKYNGEKLLLSCERRRLVEEEEREKRGERKEKKSIAESVKKITQVRKEHTAAASLKDHPRSLPGKEDPRSRHIIHRGKK